jgi:FkbM family methyltransferase
MLKRFREAVWELSHRTPAFRGKERIVGLLSRPGVAEGSIIEREGVRWFIQGHDVNEFTLAIRRSHSEGIANRIGQELAGGAVGVLWDVGANIGTSSLPQLARFPSLRTVMFEPSPEVAGRLVRNLAINPALVGRARLMTLALSNADGFGDLYTSNEAFNSGVGGLGNSRNRVSFGVTVQTRTADSLVASGTCEPPGLVKIDVEGFELEVLQGMAGVLAERRPPVVFEHSPYRLRERSLPDSAVIDWLRSVGYTARRLLDERPVTAQDLARDDDFIARADG